MRARFAASVAVFLAVLAVFHGALDNGFLDWDDGLYVADNPQVQSFDLRWMLFNHRPQWGPLAYVSHAVDFALFGLDPRGHHLSNLLLHALAAVAVLHLFVAVARAAHAPWSEGSTLAGASATALLFAVHPLRVESVAWVAEKKDLLCALFFVLAILAHVRGARVLTHVALGLALLAKAMAVSLPAVLLLLDFLLGRVTLARLPRLLAEKTLLFAMAGAVAWITMHPPDWQVRMRERSGELTLTQQRLVVVRATAFYVERTLWPGRLVPFYPLPPPQELQWRQTAFLAAIALAAALTAAAAVGLAFGSRAFPVAWLAYLVVLLPVSGIVPLSGQLASDRFSYLPTLGFFLLAGAVLAGARGRGRSLAWAVAGIAGIAWSAHSVAQVRIWRDSETFWRYVADSFPGRVVMAHNNLGALYHRRAIESHDPAALDRAEAEYRQAIAIFPRHANAWNNLGLVLEMRGDVTAALACYDRALQIAPQHPEATRNRARLSARASGT